MCFKYGYRESTFIRFFEKTTKGKNKINKPFTYTFWCNGTGVKVIILIIIIIKVGQKRKTVDVQKFEKKIFILNGYAFLETIKFNGAKKSQITAQHFNGIFIERTASQQRIVIVTLKHQGTLKNRFSLSCYR